MAIEISQGGGIKIEWLANHGIWVYPLVCGIASLFLGWLARKYLYEIRIKNHLDCDWSVWFEGLSITPEPGGVTLISGPVEDQA